MTLGVILLGAIVLLTFLGLTQRVFDRLHLTDSRALLFVGLLIAGSFITIRLTGGTRPISVNLGGIVPIILGFYILKKADSRKEWTRALVATVVTTGALYGLSKLMSGFGHGRDMIDPLYLYGIVAGLVAYFVAARSRRAAFVAATIGTLLLQVVNMIELIVTDSPGTVNLGGGGVFDATIIAGVLAVLLDELIGETRERLGGGHHEEK